MLLDQAAARGTNGAARRVVIVGGGFAGLNVAKRLGGVDRLEVTLLDRSNHHLFQPLLYEVAMAGLSPAEIAAPIRGLLSRHRNVRVLREEVLGVELAARRIATASGALDYDVLVLACGAQHAYFGHEAWEEHAPGLKTLEQATEIRRRVLSAFEDAEKEADPERVELAGAIGEMSRFTLARDFRRIDPKLTRVILIEAGPRILPSFSDTLASRAVRDLEALGVQVWTRSPVTGIDAGGVDLGRERIQTATALWAAGVLPSRLGATLGVPLDPQGRVIVLSDLSLPGHPEVFVIGDQARVSAPDGNPLAGIAPVALQQGKWVGDVIRNDLEGRPREPFRYRDKGQMATIGRSRAIVEIGSLRFGGLLAWLLWIVVHIYYLTGFENRLLVVIQWAWSYATFRRGARLIVGKEWRFYAGAKPREP
jgi:NADH dehydrogenase